MREVRRGLQEAHKERWQGAQDMMRRRETQLAHRLRAASDDQLDEIRRRERGGEEAGGDIESQRAGGFR
eukprot:114106-Hanusia_phi.AAC.1